MTQVFLPMRYLVFRCDRSVDVVETNGLMPLEQMRRIVGGHTEHTRHGVEFDDEPINLDLFVNETGWVQDPPLPQNPFFPRLAGPVIAGLCDENGDFQGLPERFIPTLILVLPPVEVVRS